MSVQTEIMLADVGNGLKILEINEKQTLLQKHHISSHYEQKIRQAVKNDDPVLMGEVVAELYYIAIQLGWKYAPGGYLMKHNGFMIGRGLITRLGIKSDLTFTFRTATSVLS